MSEQPITLGMMPTKMLAVFIAGLLIGALAGYRSAPGDPNAMVQFGETSGLPKNCRAIVQANIDGFKNKVYTADEVMGSFERNCGTYGVSWGQ